LPIATSTTGRIAGFVEGFKEADKFLEVAKLAAERGKPIVLIKIGRSELGARAARSHTAALTGARYDAIFAQYRLIRVQDYDELLETAHLLAHTPRPGIAAVSHLGGISSLTADICGQAGLDLPLLAPEARSGINGILKSFGLAANPADVTGFANRESFPQIMEQMINDPRMGTLVVASAGPDTQAQQVIRQRDRTDKGVVLVDRKPGQKSLAWHSSNTPGTCLLHVGQVGPRPAGPLSLSDLAQVSRSRWLCHGPGAYSATG
jgi:acetyltransferase